MIRKITIGIMIVICALVGGCGAFNLVQQERYGQALRFVDNLCPLLEDYKKEHGVYPITVTEVTNLSKAPGALKPNGEFYHQKKNGESYYIAVPRPFDMWGRMKYRYPGTGWRNKDYW